MARKVNHNSKRQMKIRKARQKENNPLKYYYNMTKQNAKRRGHEFTITEKEFQKIFKNDIVGNKEQGYVLDRINPLKGYVKGNVRIVSAYQNSSQGAGIDKQIHNGNGTVKQKIEEEF